MPMNLQGKRILVTGGAGFIGSHTIDALLNRGAKVSVIDNLSTGQEKNLSKEVNFYKLNIASSKVANIFKKEKPEIVYHFATNVLVPKSTKNPLMDIDSFQGAINIFHNSMKNDIQKLVFPSSGFIYGNSSILPVNESASFQPASPYSIIKYSLESYLHFYYEAFGLPFVILRYAAIYGPRQITGAMADYIRKLSQDKQAKIWGDGSKTRDYVYIDDVVNANLLALEIRNNHPNPIFNIGSGIETTLNELYRTSASILHKNSNPIYLPDRPGEQMRYALDSTKAKNELGWEPKVSFSKGLKKRIEDFKKNSL